MSWQKLIIPKLKLFKKTFYTFYCWKYMLPFENKKDVKVSLLKTRTTKNNVNVTKSYLKGAICFLNCQEKKKPILFDISRYNIALNLWEEHLFLIPITMINN